MSVFRRVYRLFIRGYSGDNEAPTVLSVESITGHISLHNRCHRHSSEPGKAVGCLLVST